MSFYEVQPLGWVRGGRTVPLDDDWGPVRSRIEFDPGALDVMATAGLDEFSHVEVVYLFDRVDASEVCRGARHPRGRQDGPLVGILAQRAKDRPDRSGSRRCGEGVAFLRLARSGVHDRGLLYHRRGTLGGCTKHDRHVRQEVPDGRRPRRPAPSGTVVRPL